MRKNSAVNRLKKIDNLTWANDVSKTLERVLDKRAQTQFLSDLLDYVRYTLRYQIVKPNPLVFDGETIYERVGTPAQLLGGFIGIDAMQYEADKTSLYDNMDICQAIINGTRCHIWSGTDRSTCSHHDVFVCDDCHLSFTNVDNKVKAQCSCGRWETTAENNIDAIQKYHTLHLNNHTRRNLDKELPMGTTAGRRVEPVRVAPVGNMSDLTDTERKTLWLSFFNYLTHTHDALMLDRKTNATAPVNDVAEELWEDFSMNVSV